jgi:hypothetical protein
MRRSVIVAGAMLALSSASAIAQADRFSVGGGFGVTASAQASGKAYHGALSFPLAGLPWPEPEPWDERRPRPRPTAQLRAEIFYQGGTVTGSPFACERVAQIYCFGRSDENRIGGAAVFVRITALWRGQTRFYIDPVGAGLYHRRTRSRESQGPTTLCLVDSMLVSCPDNPPWATFEYRSSPTSLGANAGFGMLAQLGGLRVFAELRAHRLFESGDSIAGAVPFTVGVRF